MDRLSSFFRARASLFGLRVSDWNPESDVFASIFSFHASTGNSWLMHAVRFSGLVHHIFRPVFIELMFPARFTRLVHQIPRKFTLISGARSFMLRVEFRNLMFLLRFSASMHQPEIRG